MEADNRFRSRMEIRFEKFSQVKRRLQEISKFPKASNALDIKSSFDRNRLEIVSDVD